jgi:hypothetical protein
MPIELETCRVDVSDRDALLEAIRPIAELRFGSSMFEESELAALAHGNFAVDQELPQFGKYNRAARDHEVAPHLG